VLGFATLAAYMKIGVEHQSHYGEHYVPTSIEQPANVNPK
jgi:fumarate reductase subunit C